MNEMMNPLQTWFLALRKFFLSQKQYNFNHLQGFESVLNKNGRSLRQFKSILDFACGYGRLSKHLFDLVPDAKIYGCDIQRNLVSLCQRKYPNGHFITNEIAPPLDFENSHFDFIFSYSAFTHFSETNHAAWLKELARTLKPGGVMLHTIHSFVSLKRAAFFSSKSLKKYNLSEPVDLFSSRTDTYYYVINEPSIPEYGVSIIDKEYVMKRWPDYTGLMIIDYVEGAIESYPEGCHDIVMMVKNC